MKGFTLVEVLVATMVFVVALIPLFGVFSEGLKGTGLSQEITVAYNLAQDLMEEIKTMQFDEDLQDLTAPNRLGPEAQEARDATNPDNMFDDVDDYHNYTDSPPLEINGTPMNGFYGYSRLVTVQYVDPDNFDLILSSKSYFKRIEVRVIWSDQATKLVSIAGRY